MTSIVTETTRRAVESGADTTVIGAVVVILVIGLLGAKEAVRAANPTSSMLPLIDTLGIPLLGAAVVVVGLRLLALLIG